MHQRSERFLLLVYRQLNPIWASVHELRCVGTKRSLGSVVWMKEERSVLVKVINLKFLSLGGFRRIGEVMEISSIQDVSVKEGYSSPLYRRKNIVCC
jgi:hypothetical protein